MELFKWNNFLETEITSIDDQHKNLVNLINKLGSYISRTSKDEYIQNNPIVTNILEDLLKYTKYHFSEEETLMKANNICNDHVKMHKFKHKQFIIEIEEIHNKRNLKYIDLVEIFNYLILWLSSHILGLDRELAIQIKSIKKGMSSNDAYTTLTKSNSNEESIIQTLLNMISNLLIKNRELLYKNRELELLVDKIEY